MSLIMGLTKRDTFSFLPEVNHADLTITQSFMLIFDHLLRHLEI